LALKSRSTISRSKGRIESGPKNPLSKMPCIRTTCNARYRRVTHHRHL
jgi:hypothetical protein